MDDDALIRMAAFQRVVELEQVHGEVIPASAINEGFLFRGERILLKGKKGGAGIWKPAAMSEEAALSIATTPSSPYSDHETDTHWGYAYHRGGPQDRFNRLLRGAMVNSRPLIYFKWESQSPMTYRAEWPCWVVSDHPEERYVLVQKSSVPELGPKEGLPELEFPDEVERKYVTRQTKARDHQKQFRRIVLRAYSNHCTVCRLKEEPLLDAAHIISDSDQRGRSVVTNGLSLCAIHHRAFDRKAMTITPDYRVRVSQRLMEETDGPMLEHGIKAFNGKKVLWLPTNAANRPDREALAERLEKFE